MLKWLVIALVALAVSDGAAAQTCAGSSILTWDPPVKNNDGSPLTDLAGYKVYRGSALGSYTSAVTLTSPGQTSYIWDSLCAGPHYFVVTAINSVGYESTFSNNATKIIPGSSSVGPNPPTIPQPVTIAGPVFNFAVTTDSLIRLEAGSVVAGRPCDSSQQIAHDGAAYMRVNASLVTAFPGQQILSAWAVCR